jgi:hypothetical protein
MPQHASLFRPPHASFYVSSSFSTTSSTGPGVLDLRHNDIRSAHSTQIIHDGGDRFPLHHGLHGNPVLGVQAVDRGRALAGRDLGGAGEVLALDVVGAKDELLRGDDALDAVGDQADELGV